MAGNDMLLAPRNLKRELDGVMAAIQQGKLTEEQITGKCRRVLTFKYVLGLDKRQFIQMSGLDRRLNSPGAQELNDRLEKAAVTVVSNDGGVLPMDIDQKKTVILNIGKASQGTAFHKQLKKYMNVDRIQAHPDSLSSLSRRLGNYEKVIVAIHTEKYAAYQSMLATLSARLPLVYVYLTPLKRIHHKGNNWKKAAAVILAHSGSVTVQHFVADVLVGRETATGRLSVEVNGYRKPGEGVELDLKKTKVYFPEDYGMVASTLSQIDDIALEGIKAKAYPGCQILILKDGAPVYDKCFGTYTYGDSQKVTPETIYDIAETLIFVWDNCQHTNFAFVPSASEIV
jgi:hypothetical protein